MLVFLINYFTLM